MSEIRIPTFTDLTDKAQIRELNRVLRDLSLATQQIRANVEVPRSSEATSGSPGIRVVKKDVGPTDPDHDTLEYEKWTGRAWTAL